MNIYVSVGLFLLLFKLLSKKELIIYVLIQILINVLMYLVKSSNFIKTENQLSDKIFIVIQSTVIIVFIVRGIKNYFPL